MLKLSKICDLRKFVNVTVTHFVKTNFDRSKKSFEELPEDVQRCV